MKTILALAWVTMAAAGVAVGVRQSAPITKAPAVPQHVTGGIYGVGGQNGEGAFIYSTDGGSSFFTASHSVSGTRRMSLQQIDGTIPDSAFLSNLFGVDTPRVITPHPYP
jgi:hypothetical protein